MTSPVGRFRTIWAAWWPVILLGILTIGSYGAAVYSFGVLISPIHEQTGWSIGVLSVAYTVTSLIGGVASLASGRLLDRFGGRPVMLTSLVAGSAFLLVASAAKTSAINIRTTPTVGFSSSCGRRKKFNRYSPATPAMTTRATSDDTGRPPGE